MNILQLLKAISASHADLLAEAKHSLEEIGDCDHSVGICCCELIRRIEVATELQKLLDVKLQSLSTRTELQNINQK